MPTPDLKLTICLKLSSSLSQQTYSTFSFVLFSPRQFCSSSCNSKPLETSLISSVPSYPTCGTSLNVRWGGGCVEVRKRAISVIVVNAHHTDGDCYPHPVQYTRISPLGYCNSLLIGLLAVPYTTPCRQFSISSLMNLIQCYSSTPCPPLTQSALHSLTMSHLTRFSLYSPSHPQHGLAASYISDFIS